MSDLHQGRKPSEFPYGDCFCRWTIGGRPKALEWNHQGKGKGPTTLSTDAPPRCCSECTPQLYLTSRADDIAGNPKPGVVYSGHVAGHGWYSADPGRDFLIRLVTSEYEVPLLREQALLYGGDAPSREPLREKKAERNSKFYGFFQTDACDAAAIVLEYRGPPPEAAKRPRNKRGKKKHRGAACQPV